MPRLVGGLDGEQLHHLAEVRVQPGEEPRRHEEGGRLVLDEVAHHLDDRALQLVGRPDGASPIDGALWVPLGGDGLRVEPGRVVAPHHGLVGEREVERGGREVHVCSARGEPPPR